MTAVCVPERVLLHLVAWILSPWLGVVWGLRFLPISLFDFHLFVGCPVGLVWCGESCPSGLAWCGEHKCWVNFFAGFCHFTRISLQRKDRKFKSGMSIGSTGGGHCFATIVSVLMCHYSILSCESDRRPNFCGSTLAKLTVFGF